MKEHKMKLFYIKAPEEGDLSVIEKYVKKLCHKHLLFTLFLKTDIESKLNIIAKELKFYLRKYYRYHNIWVKAHNDTDNLTSEFVWDYKNRYYSVRIWW